MTKFLRRMRWAVLCACCVVMAALCRLFHITLSEDSFWRPHNLRRFRPYSVAPLQFMIVQQPDGKSDRVLLPKNGVVKVGRHTLNPVQVSLRDNGVAKLALLITAEGGSVFVEQAGRHALLNDIPLPYGSKSKLEPGDVIKVGKSKLTFQ